jgi:hypothetical protein
MDDQLIASSLPAGDVCVYPCPVRNLNPRFQRSGGPQPYTATEVHVVFGLFSVHYAIHSDMHECYKHISCLGPRTKQKRLGFRLL